MLPPEKCKMMTYHFECFHLAGATATAQFNKLGVEVKAMDAKHAWKLIIPMLVIPGTWVCRVRRGNRWLHSRTIHM